MKEAIEKSCCPDDEFSVKGLALEERLNITHGGGYAKERSRYLRVNKSIAQSKII